MYFLIFIKHEYGCDNLIMSKRNGKLIGICELFEKEKNKCKIIRSKLRENGIIYQWINQNGEIKISIKIN